MIAPGTHTRGTRKPVARAAFTAALALTLTATHVVATPGSSGQAQPTAVAPGAADRFDVVASSCPTFSWGGRPEATGYELAVYALQDDGGPARVAISTTAPRGATSWTPSADRCLAPGRYAWSLRDTDGAEWAEALLFRVSASPTPEQVRQALAVLDAYVSAGSSVLETAGEPDGVSRRDLGAAILYSGDAREETSLRQTEGTSAVEAIRGEVPDDSGETRGLYGRVSSPDGYGVVAENTAAGGADLQLAGPVDANVNESSWVLDDQNPQAFAFVNPSGAMTVRIQGDAVVTTATDQDTQYQAGNQLDLNGTTFVVREGPGSGLDADTIDGLDSSDLLSGGPHDHLGDNWVGDELNGLRVVTTSATADAAALRGVASSPTGFVYGVWGDTASTTGRGVAGWSRATSGQAYGVHGRNSSPQGAAVFGWTTAPTGFALGISGKTSSSSGIAIFGTAIATSGTTYGVYGRNYADSGAGIVGFARKAGGTAAGVLGDSQSVQGVGGLFTNSAGGLLLAANDQSSLTDLEFSVDTAGNVSLGGQLNCSGCVDGTDLANNSVGPGQLIAASVGAAHIASGAVLRDGLGFKAVGRDALESRFAVMVECNGDCSDANLTDICGHYRSPISVSCARIWSTSLGVSCGDDNTCHPRLFNSGNGVTLESFCRDTNGIDAIVTCIVN